MRYLSAVLVDIIPASICGLGAGYLFTLGDRAFAAGVGYLVALAIPSNLVLAIAVYVAVRGSASIARGGVVVSVALSLLHLLVTVGVAAWSAELVGSGAAAAGSHTFTWGMGFAYLGAMRDARRGVWFAFGDDP